MAMTASATESALSEEPLLGLVDCRIKGWTMILGEYVLITCAAWGSQITWLYQRCISLSCALKAKGTAEAYHVRSETRTRHCRKERRSGIVLTASNDCHSP